MRTDPSANVSASEAPLPESASGEHSSAVAGLYDKLFSFEVRNASSAYPIHKKLNFAHAEVTAPVESNARVKAEAQPLVTDIYHWLAQHIPLSDFSHILDAGCGVGFGCQTLAQYTDAQISGISLSAEEIGQARHFANVAGLTRLSFTQRSFEALSTNSCDCILMVESLKHCSDLDKALASVSQALLDNGTVYVVEDVYQPHENKTGDSKLQQQLCQDWHLKKLWTLTDIENSAQKSGLTIGANWDLTLLMQKQFSPWVRCKLALFSLMSALNKSSVCPVYRGGFILDWLYAKDQMRYQVLQLTKRESA